MKIPDWEECLEMEDNEIPMNPLERFVYEYEISEGPTGNYWRDSLQMVVDYVEEQAKGGK